MILVVNDNVNIDHFLISYMKLSLNHCESFGICRIWDICWRKIPKWIWQTIAVVSKKLELVIALNYKIYIGKVLPR
jgi:hypothetical protein